MYTTYKAMMHFIVGSTAYQGMMLWLHGQVLSKVTDEEIKGFGGENEQTSYETWRYNCE